MLAFETEPPRRRSSSPRRLRETPRVATLALLGLPLFTLWACEDAPTEVIVEVNYDGLECPNRAVIAAGPVGELGDRAAAANSTTCDEKTGSLGRIVVVPKAEQNSEFAVEVRIRPDGGDAGNTCYAVSGYDGCIVARRIASFLPGRTVTMRIDLRDPCLNVPCDQTTSCVARGLTAACVTARIDLDKCKGDACSEEDLVLQSESGFSPCDAATDPCDKHGRCVFRDDETPQCVCARGYVNDEDDEYSCVDVDECETGEHDCESASRCKNTDGGFECAQSGTGGTGSGGNGAGGSGTGGSGGSGGSGGESSGGGGNSGGSGGNTGGSGGESSGGSGGDSSGGSGGEGTGGTGTGGTGGDGSGGSGGEGSGGTGGSDPGPCGAGNVVVGQFATWCGRVNQYTSMSGWADDPDCDTGCTTKDLAYCQKFWPSSTEVHSVTPNELKTFHNRFCSGGDLMSVGQEQYACCAPE